MPDKVDVKPAKDRLQLNSSVSLDDVEAWAGEGGFTTVVSALFHNDVYLGEFDGSWLVRGVGGYAVEAKKGA